MGFQSFDKSVAILDCSLNPGLYELKEKNIGFKKNEK